MLINYERSICSALFSHDTINTATGNHEFTDYTTSCLTIDFVESIWLQTDMNCVVQTKIQWNWQFDYCLLSVIFSLGLHSFCAKDFCLYILSLKGVCIPIVIHRLTYCTHKLQEKIRYLIFSPFPYTDCESTVGTVHILRAHILGFPAHFLHPFIPCRYVRWIQKDVLQEYLEMITSILYIQRDLYQSRIQWEQSLAKI